MKNISLLFALSLLLLTINKNFSQSTQLGQSSLTSLTLFEYYNHAPSEWIKVFKVKNSNWNYGGAVGSLYFVDYQGEGASRIDFTFPQFINSDQKPLLKLIGNSSRDISWYVLPSSDNAYYEVYIKTPDYHVGLSFLFREYATETFIIPQIPPTQNWIWASTLNPESLQTELSNGNVGIGTINPLNKLDVNGTIHSKEVKVDMSGWSDFVFRKEYNLPTLEEVEKHIAERGHLANIPSEEEVLKEGINLGEMNSKLLRKIEELTLYMIEKDKQVHFLSKENNKIRKDYEELKEMLLDRIKTLENKKISL